MNRMILKQLIKNKRNTSGLKVIALLKVKKIKSTMSGHEVITPALIRSLIVPRSIGLVIITKYEGIFRASGSTGDENGSKK